MTDRAGILVCSWSWLLQYELADDGQDLHAYKAERRSYWLPHKDTRLSSTHWGW